MGLVVVEDTLRASKLAASFAPTIYHGLGCANDFLSPLLFGSRRSVLMHQIPKFLWPPVLYFSIKEDSNYIYSYFMLVHPFDWSHKPVDENAPMYDMSSMCFRCNVYTSVIDVATKLGCYVKVKSNIQDKRMYITTGGHSIIPFMPGCLKISPSYAVLNTFRFINLNTVPEKQWDIVKKLVAPNSIPREQIDQLWWEFRSKDDVGLMYYNPDKLFKKAEQTKEKRCLSTF